MKRFTAQLAPKTARIVGGYSACSLHNIHPDTWADELFGEDSIPGPWLACYMLRRFGWPNIGSDDYKNLFSWSITTPMPGLFLTVTPYLGGSNIHFGVSFTKPVGDLLYSDPERDRHFAKVHRSVERWWKTRGSALYVLGAAKKEDPEEILVENFSEKDGQIYGLYKRTEKHGTKYRKFPPKKFQGGGIFMWCLSDFVRETHPEWKLPKWKKRNTNTRLHIQVRSAVTAALRDLLRPTNVRDISFTPFGDIERTDAAKAHYKGQKHVLFFEHAGYTPEYLYTKMKKEEK